MDSHNFLFKNCNIFHSDSTQINLHIMLTKHWSYRGVFISNIICDVYINYKKYKFNKKSPWIIKIRYIFIASIFIIQQILTLRTWRYQGRIYIYVSDDMHKDPFIITKKNIVFDNVCLINIIKTYVELIYF